MRIAVTGASGFLGKQLVPILHEQGFKLLLISRTPVSLMSSLPYAECCDYTDLEIALQGCDVLLHLAARNNDQEGDLEAFRAVNVQLLATIIAAAQQAGVPRFINATTLQADACTNASPYARSKAEAESLLAQQANIEVVNLRLPAVYGSEYRGKLAALNKMPKLLRPLAFSVLSALKPTVHIKHVAQAVQNAVSQDLQGNVVISDRQMDNKAYAISKRLIDISFALFVIVFLWWLLLGAWIAVRLSSPGGAIFAQERIGQHRAPFVCYKFRTMHMGTRQAGTHEMSTSSITRVGAILRKTKIDELPQILNLLRGNLSLVGPRPGLPVQTELLQAREKLGVYEVLPGITGWAQVQDIDMSDPERLARTDAEYITMRSLLTDIKIILATATGRGQGDKVKNGTA